MKIGIFDSGVGGLIITHSLIKTLPQYDYIYLGDSARVPYGSRSPETVYKFTQEAVEYLFSQDCALVILACNTASAIALSQLQKEYLPKHYPDRRILGVLVPAAEAAIAASREGNIGVLATSATINSGVFTREIHKLTPEAKVISHASPLLVPLVENFRPNLVEPILTEYLSEFSGIDTLVLGCTHYPYLKNQIKELLGDDIAVVSQDEIVPAMLSNYVQRSDQLQQKLSITGTREFAVTDITKASQSLAADLFEDHIDLVKVTLG